MLLLFYIESNSFIILIFEFLTKRQKLFQDNETVSRKLKKKKERKKKEVVHLRQVANMQEAVEMVGFLFLSLN